MQKPKKLVNPHGKIITDPLAELEIEKYRGFFIKVAEVENPYDTEQEMLTKNPDLNKLGREEEFDRLKARKLYLARAATVINDKKTGKQQMITFKATSDDYRDAGRQITKIIDQFVQGMGL